MQIDSKIVEGLFPKYRGLFERDADRPNEQLEYFIREQLPDLVRILQNLESTFTKLLHSHSALILKKQPTDTLFQSFLRKVSDKLEKYFAALDDYVGKSPEAFEMFELAKLREEVRGQLEPLGELLAKKLPQRGRNSALDRTKEEEIAQSLYMILEYYQWTKSDATSIGAKFRVSPSAVLEDVRGGLTVGDPMSLVSLDATFREVVAEYVNKKCRPFLQKRDFFTSKLKEICRETESRVASSNPKQYMRSILTREHARCDRDVINALQHSLRQNPPPRTYDKQLPEINQEMTQVQADFHRLKNNAYYLDIIRGNFVDSYQMETKKLENVFAMGRLEKYLQEVYALVERMKDLLNRIVENRKGEKEELQYLIEKVVDGAVRELESNHKQGTPLRELIMEEIDRLKMLLDAAPDTEDAGSTASTGGTAKFREEQEAREREREARIAAERQRREEQERLKKEDMEVRAEREKQLREERRIKEEERKARQQEERLKRQQLRKMEEADRHQRLQAEKLQKEQKRRLEAEQLKIKQEQDRQRRQREVEERERKMEETKQRQAQEEKRRKEQEELKKKKLEEDRKAAEENRKRQQQQLEEKRKREQEEKARLAEEEKQRKAEKERIEKEKQKQLQQDRKKEQQRRRQQQEEKARKAEEERRAREEKILEDKKKEEQKRKAELARIQKEKEEAAKKEQERQEQEAQEKKKKETEKRQREERQREEKAKIQREKEEAEAREKERREREAAEEKKKRELERAEAERKQKELEAERKRKEEEERKEKERLEQVRLENERKEKERKEEERKQQEKREKERLQKQRLQKERKQRQKQEEEQREKERRQAEKLEKERKERQKKQEEARLKKAEEEKKAIKPTVKDSKKQVKSSAIDYANAYDDDEDIVDEEQLNPIKKPVAPAKPAEKGKPAAKKDDDFDFLNDDIDFGLDDSPPKKPGKPTPAVPGVSPKDDYEDDFEPADNAEQSQGQSNIETKELMNSENVKLFNDYLKGTQYARKNKVNLEPFNNFEQFVGLFEQFVQNQEVYFVEPAITQAMFELPSAMDDPAVYEQEATAVLQALGQAYQNNLQQLEFNLETRYFFPINFANPLKCRIIEFCPVVKDFVFFLEAPLDSADEVQQYLERLVDCFCEVFGVQGSEEEEQVAPQLQTIMLSEANLQVLSTFDNLLPALLILFNYLYEYKNRSALVIDQYTIDRFFYASHCLDALYKAIETEDEKLSEHFQKIQDKFEADKAVRVVDHAFNLADPHFVDQMLANFKKDKDSFLKESVTTVLSCLSFEQTEGNTSADVEQETGVRRCIYTEMTKAPTKPILNLYLFESDQDSSNFNQALFSKLMSQEDPRFETNVYLDYTRHNGLYQYNNFSLPLWAHVTTKKKMKPVDALAVLNFSMLPILACYRGQD